MRARALLRALLPAAAGLVLGGGLPGCGGAPQPAPEPRGDRPRAVSYVESGGFALRRVEVRVGRDGRGTVRSAGRRVTFEVGRDASRRLLDLAARADASRRPGPPRCCDQPDGLLVVDGRELAPAAAAPLARELRALLRRHLRRL
jgi:hypothetical protein